MSNFGVLGLGPVLLQALEIHPESEAGLNISQSLEQPGKTQRNVLNYVANSQILGDFSSDIQHFVNKPFQLYL